MPPLAETNDSYPLASAYALPAASPSPNYQRASRLEGDIYAGTGSLASMTVRGFLKLGSSGAIQSGQSAYNTGTGFWLEANKGAPRLSIGNPLSSYFTYDGTNVSMSGSLTATSGAIGGWTVNTSNLAGGNATLDSSGFLNLGTGNNIVKASSTDATYRLWVGNATAASAPFSVDKTGALSSTSGSIGGWSITSSALQLGSAGTTRGIDSGTTAFYAGSSTPSSAPFRVTTAGALTASNINVTGGTVTANAITTGTLTFGSSGTVNTTGTVAGTFGGLNLANLTVTGTITLGSGGSIVDADGSTWDQTGITLVSSGSFGDAITWKTSGTAKGSIFSSSSTFVLAYGSGSDSRLIFNTGGAIITVASSATIGAGNMAIDVNTSRINLQGALFPGTAAGGSTQTTRSIADDGTDMLLTANTIRITGSSSFAGLRFNAIANGGSASNWSSFGTANIPSTSAGYFKINIAGTNYRVPFYADA